MMDVGIDVGGTNLRAGVVDEQGKLLSRVSQPVGTLKSPEELIRRLAELAQKAVEDAGTPENQIQSVGVGIPGAISLCGRCRLSVCSAAFSTARCIWKMMPTARRQGSGSTAQAEGGRIL